MKRKSKLVLLLGSLVSLVAADVLVSLLVLRDGLFLGYPVPPFESITHPRQQIWLEALTVEQSKGIGAFDAELGWNWRPSSRTDAGDVTINSMGARGPREYDPKPPPGTRRILTFGDSFTFGDEMADDLTFQALLEQRHGELEVINFGVAGYGTDQALLRYQRLGRDLGAEVVCIGILLENIGRNVNRYRPLWNTSTGFCATKPRFAIEPDGELRLLPQPYSSRLELHAALSDGSVFETVAEGEYWLGRPHVPTGRLSSLVRIAAGVWAQRERSPARLWRDVAGEPFQVTVAVLEAFHQAAIADGARLAPVLIFPMRGDLIDHGVRGGPYWDEFLAELERRGVPTLNLIPPLLERHLELEANPEEGTLYYKGHLSTVGNSIVADELYRWLAENL